MIAGINYLRIFSVMIADWETNETDLQAYDFGNLGKNNSGNILVGNHAAIFTEISSLVGLPLQSLAVKKNFFLCKFWAVKNF